MGLGIVAGVITVLARGEPRGGLGHLPGQGGGEAQQGRGEARAEQARQPGQAEDQQDEGGAGNHEGGGEDHLEGYTLFSLIFPVFTISDQSRVDGETDRGGAGSRQPRHDTDICNKTSGPHGACLLFT